jgi:hypothetical protein
MIAHALKKVDSAVRMFARMQASGISPAYTKWRADCVAGLRLETMCELHFSYRDMPTGAMF